MRKLTIMILAACLMTCGSVRPAMAVKKFYEQFGKLYVGEDKDSPFGKAVGKAKCYICHQGKKKKHRNRYGAELSKLLDKKKDAKNPEKIVEALKKVGKMHLNAKDSKSPTYGDMIKASKLPGGTIEEAKKEPPKK